MFYKSNALYDYFRSHNTNNFEFCSGDLWQLVYGDFNCDPKLLVVVSGVSSININSQINSSELRAYKRLDQIANLTNTPILFIRFAIDNESINTVSIFSNKNDFISISMDQLTNLFSSYGLNTTKTTTAKYLNSAESSAYHKWQRTSLGRDIKVSDLDLIKVSNNNIQAVYELKRSYISLEQWEPFRDDYTNFKLLGNLLSKANIPLQIVYNVRYKKPFFDDINELKIFNVNVNSANLIQFSHRTSLINFINY